MVERPQPERVPDTAIDADKDDSQPTADCKPGQRPEKTLSRGKRLQKKTDASMANALTGAVGYFWR